MKRWSIIFKTLSNPNRLIIIKYLSGRREATVFQLSEKLKISPKATSKHLIMLKDLDVLDFVGRENNVFYSINRNMPRDFKKSITLFV